MNLEQLDSIVSDGKDYVEQTTSMGTTYLKAFTDFTEDIDLEYDLDEKDLLYVIDELREYFIEDITEERNSVE